MEALLPRGDRARRLVSGWLVGCVWYAPHAAAASAPLRCKRPARPLPKLTSLALGRTDAIFYMVGSWGDETISGAVMVAAMLTVVSVVWLVASHTKPSQIGDEAKCKPKMVERYFVAGAAAFIVGWGWVLVVDAIIRSISAAFGSSWEVGRAPFQRLPHHT